LKDSQRARILLHHQEKGYSIAHAIRAMGRRYALSLALFMLIIAFLVARPDIEVLWMGIGLYMGMLARDAGWLMATRRAWPFTARIIDWQRVRQIAGDE
jgi:hypothetical protein